MPVRAVHCGDRVRVTASPLDLSFHDPHGVVSSLRGEYCVVGLDYPATLHHGDGRSEFVHQLVQHLDSIEPAAETLATGDPLDAELADIDW